MTRVPLGISARPLDFYVAFLVFFMGAYTFIDPHWPPGGPDEFKYWVIMIEDIYLMVSGLGIMFALIVKQIGQNRPIRGGLVVASVIAEMFGWLFVSAASAVIAATSWAIPPTALEESFSPVMSAAWFLIWGGLAACSFARWRDLKKLYKGKK